MRSASSRSRCAPAWAASENGSPNPPASVAPRSPVARGAYPLPGVFEAALLELQAAHALLLLAPQGPHALARVVELALVAAQRPPRLGEHPVDRPQRLLKARRAVVKGDARRALPGPDRRHRGPHRAARPVEPAPDPRQRRARI